jgi:hypothetical protein
MTGFSFALEHPEAKLVVTAADSAFLLASGNNSNVFATNDALPDTDGLWRAAVADNNTGLSGNEPEFGPGVLQRLTFQTTPDAQTGVWPLRLMEGSHFNPTNEAVAPHSLGRAFVAFAQDCPASLDPPPLVDDVFAPEDEEVMPLLVQGVDSKQTSESLIRE